MPSRKEESLSRDKAEGKKKKKREKEMKAAPPKEWAEGEHLAQIWRLGVERQVRKA